MSRETMQRVPGTSLWIALSLIAASPGCGGPGIAPSYPGTLVLVADDAANTLLEIEPNSGHVRHRYAVAGPVVAIATARNGQYAATIDARGDVVVCDLARQGIDATWQAAGSGRATGLVFADRRSTLAASFAGSGDVLLIGRESGRVEARIATDCASIVALSRSTDGDTLLAGCSGPDAIVRVDPAGRRVVERFELAATPTSIAAGAFENGTRAQPGRPRSAAFDFEVPPLALASDLAGRVLVASARSTGEVLIALEEHRGEPLRIQIAAAEPAPAPWPVVVDPDGHHAFVSIAGEGRVVVVDLRAGEVRGEFTVGGRPGAVAWTLRRAQPRLGLGVGLEDAGRDGTLRAR